MSFSAQPSLVSALKTNAAHAAWVALGVCFQQANAHVCTEVAPCTATIVLAGIMPRIAPSYSPVWEDGQGERVVVVVAVVVVVMVAVVVVAVVVMVAEFVVVFFGNGVRPPLGHPDCL